MEGDSAFTPKKGRSGGTGFVRVEKSSRSVFWVYSETVEATPITEVAPVVSVRGCRRYVYRSKGRPSEPCVRKKLSSSIQIHLPLRGPSVDAPQRKKVAQGFTLTG